MNVKRAWPIEIHATTRSTAANGHELKRRRGGWLAALERIVQGLRDEGAHGQAPRGGFPTYASSQLVIERNGGLHYAEHDITA